MNLEDLTLRDLGILGDLPRFRSLRTLAQSYRADVSHVSRLVKKMESLFSELLIERSRDGYTLTSLGHVLSEKARFILLGLRDLEDLRMKRKPRKKRRVFKIGAQGFLNTIFSPAIVAGAGAEEVSLNFLDLNDDELVIAAKAGVVNLAMHIGLPNLSSDWITQKVANLGWGLYADSRQPGLSLHMEPAICDDWSVVTENHWDGVKIVSFENILPYQSPLSVGTLATETASTAISLASSSRVFCYVPDIAVQYSRNPYLVKVAIKGIPELTRDLFFSAEKGSISSRNFEKMSDEISKQVSLMPEISKP